MASRITNKTPLISLLMLSAVYAITQWMDARPDLSNFSATVVQIDTASVTTVVLKPQVEQQQELMLSREGQGWIISKGDVVADVPMHNMQSVLAELANLKPSRLASRDPEKWANYSVTDSAATIVQVYAGEQLLADLNMGAFKYVAKPAPEGMPMQQQQQPNVRGISYWRINGQDEVYSSDGFLAKAFDRKFMSWRKQTFLQCQKENIRSFRFEDGTEPFAVTLNPELGWMIGDQKADSVAVQNYLNLFAFRNLNDFDDTFEPSFGPNFSITVEGENMEPLVLTAWVVNDEKVVMHSSINPRAYFAGEPDGIFEDFFVRKERFLPQLSDSY